MTEQLPEDTKIIEPEIDQVKEKLEAYLGEPLDPPKEEDTSKEETVEDTVVTPPVVEDKPSIDPNAIKEELKNELLKELKEKPPEETAEGEKAPWIRENRNPEGWEEISDWAAYVAEQKLIEKMKQAQEVMEKQESERLEAENKYLEEFNKNIDSQLEELRIAGHLPPVKNAQDENDEGRKAQYDLFKQLGEHNQKLIAEGKKPFDNVELFFYKHYKGKSSVPDGSKAPVLGGKTSVQQESKDDYYYDDIRKARSLRDLIG